MNEIETISKELEKFGIGVNGAEIKYRSNRKTDDDGVITKEKNGKPVIRVRVHCYLTSKQKIDLVRQFGSKYDNVELTFNL